MGDEVVEFLRKRIEYYRRLKVLKRVREVIEKIRGASLSTVANYVRRDRDSNWFIAFSYTC